MKFNIPGYRRQAFLVGIIMSSLLLLQGCGSKKGITIDSDPQGANILADGKNIGKTPMEIMQDDVFPPHWYGRSYMVKGQLEIQKEGCESVSMEVNDLVLSTDIRETLKCKPGMKHTEATTNVVEKPEAVPVAVPAQKEVPAPAKMTEKTGPDDEIEKRLSKLEDLRNKGVISKKEYKEQRKRILESI